MSRAVTVIVRDQARNGRATVLVIVDGYPLWPLLTFFRERHLKLSTERGYAQAVSRLLNWRFARQRQIVAGGPRRLLQQFVRDLEDGTIRGEEDDTGLWWEALPSRTALTMSGRILAFVDWLDFNGDESATMSPPFISVADELRIWRAWYHRKRNSLLGHAKSKTHLLRGLSRQSSQRPLAGRSSSAQSVVRAFPDEKIEELLWHGFRKPNSSTNSPPWLRYNLRDLLITLVCRYGGVRESEPLHLWIDDIDVASGRAKLLIHEPEEGLYFYIDPRTGKSTCCSRITYLALHCCGKRPLTRETGQRHAGWKGSFLTDEKRRAFQVFWTDRVAEATFVEYWPLYVRYVRPTMPHTPWAFLAKNGSPLGVAPYTASFHRAVRRIGLEPRKDLGTTPHGLRHAYGQELNRLNLGEKQGQVMMHHRSPLSQSIYRQPTPELIARELDAALAIAVPSFDLRSEKR